MAQSEQLKKVENGQFPKVKTQLCSRRWERGNLVIFTFIFFVCKMRIFVAWFLPKCQNRRDNIVFIEVFYSLENLVANISANTS